jgi:hypothetical protein
MLFTRKSKQLLKFYEYILHPLEYIRHYQVFKEQNLRELKISQNQVKTINKNNHRDLFHTQLYANLEDLETILFLYC